MPGTNISQNETNFDRQAVIDDAVRIHAERFGRENYDEFDSNTTTRGRSLGHFKRPDFRKRRKSPCVELGRPSRKSDRIEINRQGYSFARNPSLPEMIPERSLESPVPSLSSMTGGSNDSIPSSLNSNISSSSNSVNSISSSMNSVDTNSSESSSSGLFILPKEPSRSSSRNTFSDIHSEWSSTTALDQEMDGTQDGPPDYKMDATLDQAMDYTEANCSQFEEPQTQNQTGLKVSWSIIFQLLLISTLITRLEFFIRNVFSAITFIQ